MWTYKIVSQAAQPVIELDLPQQPIVAWNGLPIGKQPNGLLAIGDEAIDLGFFHRVQAIQSDISRWDYADAQLTSRLKIRTATACIDDLSANIRAAMDGATSQRPINLHAAIRAVAVTQILNELRSKLNPDKLELLVSWYFTRAGATSTVIPPKNKRDKVGDADVVATFDPIRTIIYVQAKCHPGGATDDEGVNQITTYKADHERNDDGYSRIAWVISIADQFSPECVNAAKANNILLINGPDLAQMLLDVGLQGLDEAL